MKSVDLQDIAALNTGQISALKVADIAELTSAQVGALDTQQVAVLSSAQVGALSVAQLLALSTQQIRAISTQGIAALSGAQISKLRKDQIAALTVGNDAQLGSTNPQGPDQVGALSSTQMQSLRADQVAALTSQQIGRLSSTQLNALSLKQMQSVDVQDIVALTTGQISALQVADIAELTSAQVGALDTQQVAVLSSAQVSALSVGQLLALSTQQIRAISTQGIAALSGAQISKLRKDQIAALTVGNDAQLGSPNPQGPDQVGALSSTQMQSLRTDQVAALTSQQMGRLSSTQLNALSLKQMQSVDVQDIAALTTGQISALKVADIAELTSAQVGALDTQQVAALSSAQVSALSVAQLLALSTQQIRAISTQGIAALSGAQMSKLRNDQIAALTYNGEVSSALLNGRSSYVANPLLITGSMDGQAIGGQSGTLIIMSPNDGDVNNVKATFTRIPDKATVTSADGSVSLTYDNSVFVLDESLLLTNGAANIFPFFNGEAGSNVVNPNVAGTNQIIFNSNKTSLMGSKISLAVDAGAAEQTKRFLVGVSGRSLVFRTPQPNFSDGALMYYPDAKYSGSNVTSNTTSSQYQWLAGSAVSAGTNGVTIGEIKYGQDKTSLEITLNDFATTEIVSSLLSHIAAGPIDANVQATLDWQNLPESVQYSIKIQAPESVPIEIAKTIKLIAANDQSAPLLKISRTLRTADEDLNNGGFLIAFNGGNSANVTNPNLYANWVNIWDKENDFAGGSLKLSYAAGGSTSMNLGVIGSSNSSRPFSVNWDTGDVSYYASAKYFGQDTVTSDGVARKAFDVDYQNTVLNAPGVVIGQLDAVHRGQKGDSLVIYFNASITKDIVQALASNLTAYVRDPVTSAPTQNWAAAAGDKLIKFELTDAQGNTAVDSQPMRFVSHPEDDVVVAQPIIDLGSYGKLIAPVQVEGKWYYFWDRSGNGAASEADWTSHDVLDNLFNQDINGVVNTTVANADGLFGTTDTYRYATLNGVHLALPTMNGNAGQELRIQMRGRIPMGQLDPTLTSLPFGTPTTVPAQERISPASHQAGLRVRAHGQRHRAAGGTWLARCTVGVFGAVLPMITPPITLPWKSCPLARPLL
jgi:transcriptional antiterminator Rof (Rho-off)